MQHVWQTVTFLYGSSDAIIKTWHPRACRFGMMCSQMKSFFDATGGLWQTGALAGKPVTAFTSTGTQVRVPLDR